MSHLTAAGCIRISLILRLKTCRSGPAASRGLCPTPRPGALELGGGFDKRADAETITPDAASSSNLPTAPAAKARCQSPPPVSASEPPPRPAARMAQPGDAESQRPLLRERTEGPLTFARVVEEERCLLDERRAECGGAGEPFSLAFSGGGVRAAAFQAGVLWRLAEEGRLRDVEYMTAVSGGGYITAAFISQLLASEPPARGERGELDAWYLGAVARTICRMQRNSGIFVRDVFRDPLHITFMSCVHNITYYVYKHIYIYIYIYICAHTHYDIT